MRIICFMLLAFILSGNLLAQTKGVSVFPSLIPNQNDSGSAPENEMVNTPFGPTLRSNVHYVGKKYHLNNKDNLIQLIQTNSGKVCQEYYKEITSNRNYSESIILNNNFTSSPTDNSDGWITYAYGDVHVSTPKLTYFSADWIVPSPPDKSSNQLLYLFNGLQGGNLYGLILQPVLQWGISPAGGGNHWAIANWFVSGDGQFFYDTLIKVNPGTRLQGVIKLTSVSNNLYSYNSSFTGYSTGLQINNTSELTTTYIGLEAYNIKGCDEYPKDEGIKMFNIQIVLDSIYPPLIWNTYNRVTSCGQYTRIINKSPNNGQIDIYFHTPYSFNGFDEIHFYPNPVENMLHISPSYIVDPMHLFPDKPISNCKIEIFNSLGRLIKSDFYERFDYEFNLDLSNFDPGLYIIRFSYNNESHAFKIIKK